MGKLPRTIFLPWTLWRTLTRVRNMGVPINLMWKKWLQDSPTDKRGWKFLGLQGKIGRRNKCCLCLGVYHLIFVSFFYFPYSSICSNLKFCPDLARVLTFWPTIMFFPRLLIFSCSGVNHFHYPRPWDTMELSWGQWTSLAMRESI